MARRFRSIRGKRIFLSFLTIRTKRNGTDECISVRNVDSVTINICRGRRFHPENEFVLSRKTFGYVFLFARSLPYFIFQSRPRAGRKAHNRLNWNVRKNAVQEECRRLRKSPHPKTIYHNTAAAERARTIIGLSWLHRVVLLDRYTIYSVPTIPYNIPIKATRKTYFRPNNALANDARDLLFFIKNVVRALRENARDEYAIKKTLKNIRERNKTRKDVRAFFFSIWVTPTS